MKRIIAFLCVFFFWGMSNAQQWQFGDSIKLALKNKPTFSAGLDGKYSYVSGIPVNIFGLRLGADFKKIGVYGGLYSTFLRDNASQNEYSYFYIAAQGEYRWYWTYRWQLVQTVQLGVGNADLTIRKPNGEEELSSRMIIPIETGILGTYRIWKFIGVSGGVGARISATPNTYFSSSYYTLGFVLFFDEIEKTYNSISK